MSGPVNIGLEEKAGAMVRALLGAEFAVASTNPRAPAFGLYPVEAEAVANAVDHRRREFAAGRRAARRAMAELRHPEEVVAHCRDRAPVWPEALTGSISHSARCCVAALARASAITSVGIDIEDAGALPAELLDIVCTMAERDWLERQPVVARGALAKLIFSAKEAVYKCQYPVSRDILEFHDVMIAFSPNIDEFSATLLRPAGPFPKGETLHGRCAMDEDLIASVVFIRRRCSEPQLSEPSNECFSNDDTAARRPERPARTKLFAPPTGNANSGRADL